MVGESSLRNVSNSSVTLVSATEMERYGSVRGEMSVSAPKFEHAVRSLASGTVHGDEAFGLRSLVVFCVAEALRFESLAHDVGFALHTMDVAGGVKAMPLGRWWPTMHAWGQACDAIWAGLNVDLRRASLLPATTRTGGDRTRAGRAMSIQRGLLVGAPPLAAGRLGRRSTVAR